MLPFNFENKEALLDAFASEQICIDYLEELRWSGLIISPFFSSSKVYFCKKNIYKCKVSGKYFNVKTNTLFHNTKIDLQKWFVAIWIVSSQNKKINSVALSKELKITQKSAWYMIKRIKLYLNSNENAFNKKNIQTLLPNRIRVSNQIVTHQVNKEEEKLPLLQWLQLLKK